MIHAWLMTSKGLSRWINCSSLTRTIQALPGRIEKGARVEIQLGRDHHRLGLLMRSSISNDKPVSCASIGKTCSIPDSRDTISQMETQSKASETMQFTLPAQGVPLTHPISRSECVAPRSRF